MAVARSNVAFRRVASVGTYLLGCPKKKSISENSSSHLLKSFHMGSHFTTQSFSNFENVVENETSEFNMKKIYQVTGEGGQECLLKWVSNAICFGQLIGY